MQTTHWKSLKEQKLCQHTWGPSRKKGQDVKIRSPSIAFPSRWILGGSRKREVKLTTMSKNTIAPSCFCRVTACFMAPIKFRAECPKCWDYAWLRYQVWLITVQEESRLQSRSSSCKITFLVPAVPLLVDTISWLTQIPLLLFNSVLKETASAILLPNSQQ